jgi:hypothetical protein
MAKYEIRRWSKAEDKWPGRDSDRAIARRLGRTVTAVRTRRRQLGIRSSAWREIKWVPAQEKLLGTMPDRKVARRLGRSATVVHARRTALGIRPFNPSPKTTRRPTGPAFGAQPLGSGLQAPGAEASSS